MLLAGAERERERKGRDKVDVKRSLLRAATTMIPTVERESAKTGIVGTEVG